MSIEGEWIQVIQMSRSRPANLTAFEFDFFSELTGAPADRQGERQGAVSVPGSGPG